MPLRSITLIHIHAYFCTINQINYSLHTQDGGCAFCHVFIVPNYEQTLYALRNDTKYCDTRLCSSVLSCSKSKHNIIGPSGHIPMTALVKVYIYVYIAQRVHSNRVKMQLVGSECNWPHVNVDRPGRWAYKCISAVLFGLTNSLEPLFNHIEFRRHINRIDVEWIVIENNSD